VEFYLQKRKRATFWMQLFNKAEGIYMIAFLSSIYGAGVIGE
jgi:hypothetical protein